MTQDTLEKFETVTPQTNTVNQDEPKLPTKADFERAKYRASIMNIDKKDADFEVIELLFDNKPKAYRCLVNYKSLLKLLNATGVNSIDELIALLKE